MQKRCVICDEIYYPEVDRYDNVTCSVACRSKLHRERRKAQEERKAKLISNDEKRIMIWLKNSVPDAHHDLNKLKAIYGFDAFKLGYEAIKATSSFILKNKVD